MIENKRIITGIDIGTTKIAVVIAECILEKNQIRILGVGEAPSYGLKKGIVNRASNHCIVVHSFLS